MTKKQVTPKFGGQKSQRNVSRKLPQAKPSKLNKPTPALTAETTEVVRPVQVPMTSQESSPLLDLDYRIFYPSVEFNLLEVHNWCFGKSVEKSKGDIPIWESNLPRYVVPFTHQAPVLSDCVNYIIFQIRDVLSIRIENSCSISILSPLIPCCN